MPRRAGVLASMSSVAPTIYEVSPNLKASLNMQAAVGIEHQFGKAVTTSVTYINSRGIHQYLSDNVNALSAGTYDLTTGTGDPPERHQREHLSVSIRRGIQPEPTDGELQR